MFRFGAIGRYTLLGLWLRRWYRRRRLHGRGGPRDQVLPTGGDGHQIEPPTPRE